MRLSELLSESSLGTCLRLRTCFVFAAGALASPSESLESNEGTLLAAVWDEGLGLERASSMDGCFTSIIKFEVDYEMTMKKRNHPIYYARMYYSISFFTIMNVKHPIYMLLQERYVTNAQPILNNLTFVIVITIFFIRTKRFI